MTDIGGVWLAWPTWMSAYPASASQLRYACSPCTPPALVRVISPTA